MAEDGSESGRLTERAREALVRIALIVVLATWCLEILRPVLMGLSNGRTPELRGLSSQAPRRRDYR